MCGIFALFCKNKFYTLDTINKAFQQIKHRGPDSSSIIEVKHNIWLGFHRLSINDLSDKGMQPFNIGKIFLICNGEIYNSAVLKREYKLDTISNSDCEVIIHLYKKFGIYETIKKLHGVFSFALFDLENSVTYCAIDRIGVRPLFYQIDDNLNFCLSSEAKGMDGINLNTINQLRAGHILEITDNSYGFSCYYSLPKCLYFKGNLDDLRNKLINSVKLRLMSDRPIGCLLSGGLDSSLIASILAKHFGLKLNTFTIGFEDSTDLEYARKVSEFIGSTHHEIIIKYEDVIKRIPEIIKSIETYDITTIRASTAMYLASEYIKKNFDNPVIFSGEGADEILGGYLYFHSSPNISEFEKESRRVSRDLQFFDVLRADRCTAAHGLELRVPFLDQDFVKYCFEVDPEFKKPVNNIEKYCLRKAFEGYLPHDILWRKKEALSDGVGGIKKPWFKYIQEFARIHFSQYFTQSDFIKSQEIAKICNLKHYMSEESLYYYKVFKETYNFEPIPYYWMPRWNDVNDPSARILKNNL